MISTDFYEGIRQAQPTDVDAIEALLKPLTSAGITKARSRDSLAQDISCFTVLEREQEVSLTSITPPEAAAVSLHSSHLVIQPAMLDLTLSSPEKLQKQPLCSVSALCFMRLVWGH